MNRDQLRGRLVVILGGFLEWGGNLLHSKSLAAEGRREQRVGEACAQYGDAKSHVAKRVQRPTR
jgi:uncharacterized protein YjbJ (UPF0337 family)